MEDIIAQEEKYSTDRQLLHKILGYQHLLISKIAIFMSAFDDLSTLVATLKGSLDTIKSGVATIVAGIDPNGLTADQVTQLKASLTDAVSEASDDAAAVAAAQPAAPAAPVTDAPAA